MSPSVFKCRANLPPARLFSSCGRVSHWTTAASVSVSWAEMMIQAWTLSAASRLIKMHPNSPAGSGLKDRCGQIHRSRLKFNSAQISACQRYQTIRHFQSADWLRRQRGWEAESSYDRFRRRATTEFICRLSQRHSGRCRTDSGLYFWAGFELWDILPSLVYLEMILTAHRLHHFLLMYNDFLLPTAKQLERNYKTTFMQSTLFVQIVLSLHVQVTCFVVIFILC